MDMLNIVGYQLLESIFLRSIIFNMSICAHYWMVAVRFYCFYHIVMLGLVVWIQNDKIQTKINRKKKFLLTEPNNCKNCPRN